MYPGDDYWKILLQFAEGYEVKQTLDFIDTLDKGYHGITMNMIMADNSGNIGYVMLASIPNRKDKTPYIGNRVLNGETSAYDWDGLVSAAEYPRAYNPEKGYIVTANNR